MAKRTTLVPGVTVSYKLTLISRRTNRKITEVISSGKILSWDLFFPFPGVLYSACTLDTIFKSYQLVVPITGY